MHRKFYQLTAGKLSNLTLVEDNLAAPKEREIQVAVKAIGLNFADIFAIWGLYSATPEGLFTPGLEYAGIVQQVGDKVTKYKVGDKVMGITRFGAYTSHLNIHEHYAIALPANWNFDEGAAYLVQVLTAYYGLRHLGNLQDNAAILIHSAAGGVGIFANRIAKKYNAYTIGTTSSPSKLDFLKAEGYDQTIIRGKDFQQRLEAALDGRPLELIMECIGGDILKIGYNHLAPQGRMVVYGSARYASPTNRPKYLKMFYQFITRPKIDPQKMIEFNRAILGFNLIHLYERVELMHQILQEIETLDIKKPHIGHTFDFDNLSDALRLFQTGKTIGKVVVRINN